MDRFWGPGRIIALPMLTLVLWTTACSSPVGLRSDDASAQAQQQAPFRNDQTAATPTTASDTSTPTDGKKVENRLPFHDPQNVPAGTLLPVRLKAMISAEAAKRSFEAYVDDAVVIDGNTLIPRGALVTGRVQSFRSSNIQRDRGYVQLTLDSVQVAGSDMPLHSASLFARESPQEGTLTGARLAKGRRLTFRLTEPVFLATQRAMASH